jgi:hypothetical protein
MENRDIISNELMKISPLLTQIKKENVYSVAPSYFESLAQTILHRLNLVGRSAYSPSSANPYTVPEDYFKNFSYSILETIKSGKVLNEVEQELTEIAPLLNTISKNPTYRIPDGYFQNFNTTNTFTKPKARVIPISKKFLRYAAAAIITVLMAVGGYLFLQKDVRDPQIQVANVKFDVKVLKDDEIIEFLKTHSGEATSFSSEKTKVKQNIKNRLKEKSDEEIRKYLQENLDLSGIEVDI